MMPMDIDLQKNYWDNLATHIEFTHPLNLEKVRDFITPGMRLLDYGCGYGRICQELWKNGYRKILGVDISPAMIDKGKRHFPYLELITLEEYQQRVEPDSFEAVILFSVLTGIPDDQIITSLIDHLYSVLRTGGYLYISDTLLQSDDLNMQRYQQFKSEYRKYGVFRLPDGGVFRHFDITEIQAFTHKFTGIQTWYIDVLTMHNHPARAFQYLGQK